MTDVRLHDSTGRVLVVLAVPEGERPPRAIVWGDAVYLDLTRDHRDYVEIRSLFVERVPVEGEKVAGAFQRGSGV